MDRYLKQRFSSNIRAVRLALKLNQKEFATNAGLSASSISYYELGKAYPTEQTICNLIYTYKIRRAYLETGEGDMFLMD